MERVILPPFERYLNLVDDPALPPSQYHSDLTSPAPSGDHGINKENTPPQDAPRKIPRKLRPRRRKERQLGQRPIRILRPGRLEAGLSVRRQPIEIRHPKILAKQPDLRQRRFDPDHPEFRGVYKPV